MEEIHKAKYTGMEKVEERLLLDLKEYKIREKERIKEIYEVFDQKIELLKQKHKLDIREITGGRSVSPIKAQSGGNFLQAKKNGIVPKL